jgi:hypothetical protein
MIILLALMRDFWSILSFSGGCRCASRKQSHAAPGLGIGTGIAASPGRLNLRRGAEDGGPHENISDRPDQGWFAARRHISRLRVAVPLGHLAKMPPEGEMERA